MGYHQLVKNVPNYRDCRFAVTLESANYFLTVFIDSVGGGQPVTDISVTRYFFSSIDVITKFYSLQTKKLHCLLVLFAVKMLLLLKIQLKCNGIMKNTRFYLLIAQFVGSGP